MKAYVPHPFRKSWTISRHFTLPKIFPCGYCSHNQMARDFVPEKVQTPTVYLIFVFILVQVSSHSLVLLLLRADLGSTGAFPEFLWQSMTVFLPETRFQGQNSYCLQRSQCFPWHPNCNSPKGLPAPTPVDIKSQCRPAPPLFQQPHTLGMRLSQCKTKTVLLLPGKGGGTLEGTLARGS